MPPVLFRIWLQRTLVFALPLMVIGVWDSAAEGLGLAACVFVLALVSAATYASFLILRGIVDSGHPPVDC